MVLRQVDHNLQVDQDYKVVKSTKSVVAATSGCMAQLGKPHYLILFYYSLGSLLSGGWDV